MKTFKQRAPRRTRKRWLAKYRSSRAPGTITVAPYNQTEVGVARMLGGHPEQIGEAYTVMVKWVDKPRAERLTKDGTTTTRKANALVVRGYIQAEKYASGISAHANVERAWAAKF